MGVWIETYGAYYFNASCAVTPCMGVWIETFARAEKMRLACVTPCMGVWIETIVLGGVLGGVARHTLYGCVD